jgi:predicted RNA-binding Zn-ribbon protein involved in translation (DUF1610 family)
VVACHNRRIHRHGGGACIDCGTRYPVTNAYKGNYCPDCHEAWIDRQRDDSTAERPSPRFGSSPRSAGTELEDERSDDRDGSYDAE